MTEFTLQPPERIETANPIIAACSAPRRDHSRPGRTFSRHRPALDVGEPRSIRAGADAAPPPILGNQGKPPAAQCRGAPHELARMGFPKRGRFRNKIPHADEAQTIETQGEFSANRGCPPQVGDVLDTEPAPKARAHGRHRRARRGAHAPGPDRRPAAPPSGGGGGLVGLGLAFGLRADAIGCRIRMGAPPALARRSSETRYIGGSP